MSNAKMGTTKEWYADHAAHYGYGRTDEEDLLAVGDEVCVMSVQRPTEAIRRGRIKAIRQVTEFGRPVTIAQVGNVGTWLALWRLQKVARASEAR